MNITIIGNSGQVAWELQRTLAPLGKLTVLARSGGDGFIDLENPDSIRTAINTLKPDIIVNAAAYTAVDKAEEEEGKAYAVNGVAPGILAELSEKQDALLIHYSTDYVFDGTSQQPYTETDTPNPLNVYGKSKLAGENAVSSSACKHIILRTSWVYGLRGNNFLRTILRLVQERDELAIVDDQLGTPTWSRMIAEATALILSELKINRQRWRDSSGLYHLSSAGMTSWYGFTNKIVEQLDLNKELIIKPITTDQYPLPAARPHFSVLANAKVNETFGISMPSWEQALSLCLADLG